MTRGSTRSPTGASSTKPKLEPVQPVSCLISVLSAVRSSSPRLPYKNHKMALWRTIGLSSRGTVARCSLQISSIRSLSAATNQEPVYELRTYTVYPDKMREYLNITSEEFHLRTAHSKILGFWTSEIGGLNQVVHIWEYESLAHRSTVRAKLAGDKEWLSRYVSRVAGMWQQQENSLMTLLPGTSLALPSGTGVYEIQTVNLQGAGWSGALRNYVRACGEGEGARAVEGTALVGAWKGVLGPA
ncbi:protein NipSnap homolog 3B-like, partial [Penaeus indicus]|uniref:protein NipSnap homolog 3B-like n=1 Tax=Penaeus indicus TaxID=29960 RepID=UPI00300D6B2C